MEPRSDYDLAQLGRELEELTRMPGWKHLEKMADEKLAAIKESLLRVDPTNVGQIASLQAQAREVRYFFTIVREQIKRGKEADERLKRKGENDGKR